MPMGKEGSKAGVFVVAALTHSSLTVSASDGLQYRETGSPQGRVGRAGLEALWPALPHPSDPHSLTPQTRQRDR